MYYGRARGQRGWIAGQTSQWLGWEATLSQGPYAERGSHAKPLGERIPSTAMQSGQAGMATLGSSSLSRLVTGTGHLVDPPHDSLLPFFLLLLDFQDFII